MFIFEIVDDRAVFRDAAEFGPPSSGLSKLDSSSLLSMMLCPVRRTLYIHMLLLSHISSVISYANL